VCFYPFFQTWIRRPVSGWPMVNFMGHNSYRIRQAAAYRRRDERMVEPLNGSNHRQKQGPHIVTIGGGTGMPTLVRGLRQHSHNITTIVTVADDGGSSGRLRRELGLLPL
jgi:hypothetical protein